ncbi:MAG: 1-acyl-sn-glycerol-3-phosphate acyltransferase [Coriobacteriales bacterium]|nr:1-acyl-sn-glycerol-3-phosphate acyltransferase [Coriobacteriales bacterium]
MRPLDYFYDTPASGEGHFPQRFTAFLFALIRAVFGLVFRYKAYDKELLEHIPAGQGYLVAANHCSYLDPVFIMSVMRPRLVRYMAKEEFFSNSRIIARAASWVGAFPVKRDSADMTVIKRSVRMLKRGEAIGIFPEGTRIRTKEQVPVYHEGVALIAQLSGMPVVPVRLWSTEHICPEGKRLFRCPRITLRFGEPLSIKDEPFASMPKEERKTAFTEEVMARIYALEAPR